MGELQLNSLTLVVTGQCPQGRETTGTSWVGARASEKAPKTVGLWVDLAVIQSLGKTMAHVSFLAETRLEAAGLRRLAAFPLHLARPEGKGQAPPGGGKQGVQLFPAPHPSLLV